MGVLIFIIDIYQINELQSFCNQSFDNMSGGIEYEVDEILDKRTSNGKVEYYLSWKNMGPSENSWEHKADMNCKELIKSFEDSFREKKRKLIAMGGAVGNGENVTKIKSEDDEKTWTYETRPRGFDRGLVPERIVALTRTDGQNIFMFLMKWKGSDDLDLVPAKVANIKCPQVVIQFYEERNMWHTSSQDENE